MRTHSWGADTWGHRLCAAGSASPQAAPGPLRPSTRSAQSRAGCPAGSDGAQSGQLPPHSSATQRPVAPGNARSAGSQWTAGHSWGLGCSKIPDPVPRQMACWVQSGDPAGLCRTLSAQSRDPAGLCRTLSAQSRDPADLCRTLSAQSGDPAGLCRTLSAQSGDPADLCRTLSAQSRDPADLCSTLSRPSALGLRGGGGFGTWRDGPAHVPAE